MKNFVTCHCHPKSLDSGSTPQAFVDREVELGTGVVTVTDHGSLAACREVYDLARKKKLIPILGLEGYFRDDDCPILTAAGYPKNATGAFTTAPKYQHITLHFLDQPAYECGIRLLSKADARLEETLAKLEPEDRRHGHERKPLFKWAELEELGALNVTMTTGCLIGMVQRHLLDNNDLKVAEAYYQRLRSIAKPGNFFVEVFPHDCSRNWVEGVFVTFELEDGTQETKKWAAKKWLLTNLGEVRAAALAKAWGTKSNRHETLLAVKNYYTWQDLPPGRIINVEHKEEFIQNECTWFAPEGDVQAGLNKVVKALAAKYGDKILIGDDSHYARPEEKIVQDVRLAQSGNWRFYGSYHRQTSAEAFQYFQARLGTPQAEFEGWVENSHEWASRFAGFTWDVQPDLPTKFYEAKFPEYQWFKNEKVPARDHSLMYTLELIKQQGRMDWADQARVERLQREFKLLHNNDTIDLLPYFWIDEEVCSVYERAGLLTGPGRGSAAGLLLTYLLGITHVDPLRYGLSLERFITLDRIRSGKLPDIDQDLPGREILTDPETGWLWKRFGNHAAQISVDVTLKLRNAVQDVARYMAADGKVPDSIVACTKRFKMPPQGVSDVDFVLGYETDEGHQAGSLEPHHENFDPVLKEYTERYPNEWEIVKKCLGLSRQKGRHACAFVIANRPIANFIPMTKVGGVDVTAYTAPSVEAVGGLKMDFLVINSLNDLGDAIQLEQARFADTVDMSQYEVIEHPESLVGWGGARFTEKRFSLVIDGKRVPCQRLVPVNGRFYDIWDLAEDQAVFADVSEGRTETVFQFNTAGAVKWLQHFGYRKLDGTYAIDGIEAMADFTALDRPGPLDMTVRDPDDVTNERRHNLLVEYARRARGAMPSSDVLKVFDELIPETYGVMVYQEQLQRVYQALTGCTGAEAEEFRADIAKKKKAKIEQAYSPFIEKASALIGRESAEEAWKFFLTWAKYGFNKSHAVCYSVIGYACAYLKHHFALEWWCAVLKNASKNEVNEKFWKYCGSLVDLPDVKLSGPTFEIHGDRIRAPLSLLQGVGETAHTQLTKYAPYVDIDDFCRKIHAHRKANQYLVKRIVTPEGKARWLACDPVEAERYMAMDPAQWGDNVKWRLGHNALNRKVVYTLIVSGAMDSLFPKHESRTILDDLNDFETAMAAAQYVPSYTKTGKLRKAPKPKGVDERFINLSALTRYQMKKVALPAFSQNLALLLGQVGHPAVGLLPATAPLDPMYRLPEQYYFRWAPADQDPCIIGFATCSDVEAIERGGLSDGQRINVAVAGYVESSRQFSYGEERREACEVALDIEGGRFKFVKWGGRNITIPALFKTDLAGSIVIAVLTKYKTDRPFIIEDLVVVQPPLDHADEGEEDE